MGATKQCQIEEMDRQPKNECGSCLMPLESGERCGTCGEERCGPCERDYPCCTK